jgi:hypothetical protein
MKTKVIYVNPPWYSKDENNVLMKGVRAGSRWPNQYAALCKPDQWTTGMYLPYPIWLGHAATYCAKHTGANVLVRDSVALNESYGAFYRYLQAERPDIIFFESATPCWPHDKGILARIAELCPGVGIAVCGPIAHHSAGHVEEILALPNVIACVEGEYEKGSVRVVNGQTGFIPFEALTKEEMNEAPFPWQDASMVWRYHDACPHSPIMPQAHIYTSRGCMFKCRFCSFPAVMANSDADGTGNRKVRFYTPEYIKAYVLHLIKEYRIKSVYFDDDTMNLGNKHVEGICRVMKEIGIPWAAMCRADTIKWETWELMAASGCYGVKIGFESGVQSVVDRMGKDLNITEARKTVIKLRTLGLSVHTTWTLGHPGETKEQIQATMDFIKTVPHNSLQISGTALLDGTPNSEDDKKGLIPLDYNRTTEGNAKLKEVWAELAKL